MKILHIARYFQPGMGYQENGLLPAQKRLGHEVCLITSDRYAPHPNFQETVNWSEKGRIVGAGRATEQGIDVIRLPVAWEWPAHWWVVWKGLWEAVATVRPDVIHTHCAVIASSTFQVLWGNLRRRYPLVLDEHNNYFNIMPYTMPKRFLYAFFKYGVRPVLMRTVGRTLAISHEAQRFLHKELGIRPEFTRITPLGADPGRCPRSLDDARRVREQLKIPGDAVVLVNAGKITASKDNHILLEAMARLCRRTDRAYLLMIGNAPTDYRKQLEGIIRRRDFGERVRWIGFLPHGELFAHYAAADIGVWPGDASITYLECASCAVPLVLADEDYNRYAMTNNNGLFFKRGDADDLAAALYRLVSDDRLRREMGQNARQLIEQELNWDALAKQSISIYQEVIEQGRSN